jgi:hypothetical protein
MTFLDQLKDQLNPPRTDITAAERVALKNLINLAKERIWLAESHPQLPPPSMDFEAVLTDQDIANSKESLIVIEHLQSKLNDETRKY